MGFLLGLFRRGKKDEPEVSPMPSGLNQSEAQQEAARRTMEAEVADERSRRDSTDSTD